MANNVSVCDGARETMRIGLAGSVTVPFAASTENVSAATLPVDGAAVSLLDVGDMLVDDAVVDPGAVDAGAVGAGEVESDLASLPQAVTARSRAPMTTADDLTRYMK